MGCDIHANIEYDYYGNKSEEKECFFSFCTDIEIERNYQLFTILAGVRMRPDECMVIANPRGIPRDASPDFEEFWKKDGDGHSHSYVTFEELKKNKSKYKDWRKEEWYLIMKRLSKKYGSENVRLIFWFDN